MSNTRIEAHASLAAHLAPILDATFEDIGQRVEDAAKRIVPIESGDLRDTITHTVEDGELIVSAGGDDVDYAGLVEIGTRKMAAQPYLRPALTSVGARLR